MVSINQVVIRRFLLLCAPALLLSACGPGNIDVTPTLGLDTISTSAAQTFAAELTATAGVSPPTDTPTNSPVPTLPFASPPATIPFSSSTPFVGGTSDCDGAAWLADVTIPDGTIMSPGQKFTKTWSLFNSGTCAWTTAYKLVFRDGDLMSGLPTTLLYGVPVGSTVDVSVALTAPSDAGSYRGNWQMQNDKNQTFGSVIYVQIQIGAGDSTTPGPTSASGSVTISGSVGQENVTITYTGASGKYPSGSVESTGGGSYSFTVPAGWYGTVTPSKGSWTFEPANRSYVNVASNQAGQNYVAY